jgi:hypothetical protein
MVEDNPYVLHEMLVREKQTETFWDLSNEQQTTLLALIQNYKQAIEFREAQQLRLQMMMGEAGQGAAPEGGEGG